MSAQPIGIEESTAKAAGIERAASNWPARAREIEVRDQATYNAAVEALRGIKTLRDEIEETFGPIVKKAYEAHREAVAQRKKIEGPLEQAESILKGSIGAFQREQERLRREEERRLQEAAELAAAQEREAEIVEAERAGASVEEVQVIAGRPLNVAPMVAPPAVPRAAGISQRENWKSQVTDINLLVGFVAKNPTYVNLLEPNQVAINAMARSLKSAMSIPGIRVWNEPTVAVRR